MLFWGDCMGRCVVAGGTGLVGQALLRGLSESGRWEKIYDLGRRKALDDSRIETQITDWSEKEIRLPAVDTAFCCLGTTIKKAGSREQFRKVDLEYPLRFASAAQKAGARKFLIVTALGADQSSRIFYNQIKGEVELELQKLNFEALVLFHPSLLLGQRSEPRLGEELATHCFKLVGPLFRGPLLEVCPIPAKTVAASMVNWAQRPIRGIQVVNNRMMLEEAAALR